MKKRTLLVGGALAAALVISGTTGAVAGGLITSAKIKNGTVRSIDVKNGAVKSIDVKNGTLSTADFNAAVKAKLAKAGIKGLDGKSAYDDLAGRRQRRRRHCVPRLAARSPRR